MSEQMPSIAKEQISYSSRPSKLDSKLVPYSHSILSAVDTCPVWGIVHYGKRRKYETNARAMALEFGAAAHEAFAAFYLYQVGFIQKLPKHMEFHADRIFGRDRFFNALKSKDKDISHRDALINLGINILHSGEFYDDPYDNIRTTNNLEIGLMNYVDNVYPSMERWPIYISDLTDPTKPIGIECAFDIELERKIPNKLRRLEPSESHGFKQGKDLIEVMRYIGQIDRIHDRSSIDGDKHLILGENKTASRLDNAWAMAFDMSHQLTGYMLGIYTITGRSCISARVHGLKNKQTGHSEDFNSISPLAREPEAFERFIDWAFHSKAMYERYTDDLEAAPRYTHSCSRYYRPCALIPFCTDTSEGRIQQLEEMIQSDLSPSEQAVLDKIGMLET